MENTKNSSFIYECIRCFSFIFMGIFYIFRKSSGYFLHNSEGGYNRWNTPAAAINSIAFYDANNSLNARCGNNNFNIFSSEV
ncbi:Uncharacterised protein [Rothia dentocariosa]|nr:Uncharacterised protein [Rothia dentocariosa]